MRLSKTGNWGKGIYFAGNAIYSDTGYIYMENDIRHF